MYTATDGLLLAIFVLGFAQIGIEYYIAEEFRIFTILVCILSGLALAL